MDVWSRFVHQVCSRGVPTCSLFSTFSNSPLPTCSKKKEKSLLVSSLSKNSRIISSCGSNANMSSTNPFNPLVLLHAEPDAVQVPPEAAHLAEIHDFQPDLRVVLGRHVVERALHLDVVVVVVLHQPLHVLERHQIDKVHQVLLQLVARFLLDVPDVIAKYLTEFGQCHHEQKQWNCPPPMY
uniref:Uncharacterized protein n=1 Tax=Anopheles farauti TaxID=69004 RepID=A0A182QRV5_9DIPT